MTQQLPACLAVLPLLFGGLSCTSSNHKQRSADSPAPTVDSGVTVSDTGGDSFEADSTRQTDSASDSARDSAGDSGSVVTPGPWIALSCGAADCCAIADNHKFVCWGDDDFGELDALPDTTVSQVSVGSVGICLLDEVGAIRCSPGDPDWPTPAGSFSAVVAELYDGCALNDELALDCWAGDFSAPPTAGRVFPPNGQTFNTLAGGEVVHGALDDAGTPTCWGDDDSYFANASGWRSLTPTASGFTSMVCGWDHCCVLDADGYPTCWGGDYTLTVEPAAGQFSSLSAGDNATCGVVLDGSEADCWGYGHRR